MTGQERPGELVHGARSANLVKAKARAHRRRFARALGVKLSDLDAVTRAVLESWALARGRCDLYDASDVGSRNALTASNAEARALRLLQRRLAEIGRDPGRPAPGSRLGAHLSEKYGGGS